MITEESPAMFIQNFEDIIKSRSEGAPEWLTQMRKHGQWRFEELGLPTPKDEDWKYTNVSALRQQTFSLPAKFELKETSALKAYCRDEDINLIFINGSYSEDLSTASPSAKGIEITTIDDALCYHETSLKEHLQKYETKSETAFIALNKALFENGTFIKVSSNAQIEQHIHIVHVTSNGDGAIAYAPRSVIILEKSSEATVMESHIAFDDGLSYFVSPLTDIFLEENAVLHYCKAEKESLKAFHIGNTRVWQEQNSNFNGFALQCGSSINRNDLNIVLNGEGINTTLNGLYSIYGTQHIDNHTAVDHRFPNCVSNQLYKGILNESSRAVFNGKIFVNPIAQKTNSYQLNKNLLLGTDCRVDTKPQLEIFADDVKCTHGATIGQLNKDEIFYLQTRSIAKKTATKMLARGFVDDLLDQIKSRSINERLHQLLEPSFAKL